MQRSLNLALQMDYGVIRTHPYPQRTRGLAAEFAHAGKLHIEGGRACARESVVDAMRHRLVHLTDKAQGEMHLFGRCPARTRHAGLQPDEHGANPFWYFKRDKKSDHGPNSRMVTPR